MGKDIIYREDAIEALKGRENILHDAYTAVAIIRSIPSADRPQDDCETCKWWEEDTSFCYSKADSDDHACHYEPKDEPQTERSSE